MKNTTITEIVVPEIKTNLTAYDVIKYNRKILTQALLENKNHQITCSLRDGSGNFCFVGLGGYISDKENLPDAF